MASPELLYMAKEARSRLRLSDPVYSSKLALVTQFDYLCSDGRTLMLSIQGRNLNLSFHTIHLGKEGSGQKVQDPRGRAWSREWRLKSSSPVAVPAADLISY